MTEEKLKRMLKIIEYNRFISKGVRRWLIRFIKNTQRDLKVLHNDIQTIKKILVVISKKVGVKGIEDLKTFVNDEDEDDYYVEEFVPKDESDLIKIKNKVERYIGYFI